MKNIESYKHRAAKAVLKTWLQEYFEVKEEQEIMLNDRIYFIPDLTCFENNEIVAFYEVCHTHSLNAKKIGRVQFWNYTNNSHAGLYEVEAEWILRQIERPDKLLLMDYSLIFTK